MIYLDYAATTPADKKVIQKMLPYFQKKFGNPSSIHFFGREAKNAIIDSRKIWADFFGVSIDNIIFTGSATESNNLAIKGFFNYLKEKNKVKNLSSFHVITTTFEHKSVLETFKDLSQNEGLSITFINPSSEGLINPQDIKRALKDNTVLVSVMYVNNEIGTVQPIKEIAETIAEFRISHKTEEFKLKTQEQEKSHYPFFHCDCVQAVQFYDCNLKNLGIDFAVASGHKIYGPKGIGVLAATDTSFIRSIMKGGQQENNLRPGTENTAFIVGLGQALKDIIKNKSKNCDKISSLKKRLLNGIIKIYPKGYVNGLTLKTAPHILNYCFKGLDGQTLLIHLDLEGVAVSTGSACASGKIEPSHVLLSLGLNSVDAKSSIRFSLGKFTTKEEIDKTLKILSKIINLRAKRVLQS